MSVIKFFLLLVFITFLGHSDASDEVDGYRLYPNKRVSGRPVRRLSGVESAKACSDICARFSSIRCTVFVLRVRGMRCIMYRDEDAKTSSRTLKPLSKATGFFTYEFIEPAKSRTDCLSSSDPTGLKYKGTTTTTVGGRTCQRWDSDAPHRPTFRPLHPAKHKNYCRNPDKDVNGLWCYTEDSEIRWEYCDVPACSDGRTKPTPTSKPEECFACNGYNYTGKLDRTHSGKECQRWDSSTPHQHSNHPSQKPGRNLEGNFCRNPDGDIMPWCYTTDRNTRWEYCGGKRCTNPDGSILIPSQTYTTDCAIGSGLTYRGTLARTNSGKVCAQWTAQSPHRHTKTPDQYPCSGLEANYCRNPTANFEEGPWCYTTDVNTRWELCDVPKCRPGGRPPPTTTTATTTTIKPDFCGVQAMQPTFATQLFNIENSRVVATGRRKRGTREKQERILGGDIAVHGSWPWSVSLRYYDVHFCGGTLIQESWVMTASHCLDDGSSVNLLSIKVGHNFGSEAEMQVRRVRRYILHDGYIKGKVDNDIALIQLLNPVEITDYVRLACLPPPEYIVPGKSYCVVTGWGATHDPKYQNQLKQAVLPVHSYIDCLRAMGSYMQDKTQMCAGWPGQGHDTCRGDSGGPLVCLNDNRWTVQGVTSWGAGCETKKGSYGSYTRVSKYMDWIKRNMDLYS